MRDLYNVTEHGHLLRNILLFGRLLRAVGVKITPTQILDLVESLDHIDIRRRQDFKNAARTILITKHEHIPIFDRAFDLFWQARESGSLMELDLGTLLQKPDQTEKETTIELIPPDKEDKDNDQEDEPDEEPVIDKVYTYSAREVLRQKDFGDLDVEELQEIKRLMQSMHWQLEQRRTRRKTRAPHGLYLDMRRTFRQNLRHGGQPLELTWRRRKLKRRPLVVICDISGSMERYSRVCCSNLFTPSATGWTMWRHLCSAPD